MIRETAERILAEAPDPVVRYRLLRDVLKRPPDDAELAAAHEALLESRWVKELAEAQWQDGSWGRMHTRDYGAKQKIPTTEIGVWRAVELGLDGSHPVLAHAERYLAGVLSGRDEACDPAEINDRWPTGIRLFTASTLAEFDASHAMLDDV